MAENVIDIQIPVSTKGESEAGNNTDQAPVDLPNDMATLKITYKPFPIKLEGHEKIDKLTGNDFPRWFRSLQCALSSQDVWRISEEDLTLPKKGDVENIQNFIDATSVVKDYIAQTVNEVIFQQVKALDYEMGFTVPQMLWWLDYTYNKPYFALLVDYQSRLKGLRSNKFKTLSKYGKELLRLVWELNRMPGGPVMDQASVVLTFFSGLSKEWEPWKQNYIDGMNYRLGDNEAFTWPSIHFLIHDAKHSGLGPDHKSSKSVASPLAAQQPSQRQRSTSNASNASNASIPQIASLPDSPARNTRNTYKNMPSKPSKPEKFCAHCFLPGHEESTCFYLHYKEAPKRWKDRFPSKKPDVDGMVAT